MSEARRDGTSIVLFSAWKQPGVWSWCAGQWIRGGPDGRLLSWQDGEGEHNPKGWVPLEEFDDYEALIPEDLLLVLVAQVKELRERKQHNER